MISLVINHTPFRAERRQALQQMSWALGLLANHPTKDSPAAVDSPVFINDADYRGTDWQVSKVKWALDQWRWALSTDASHHVFMTDDLHIAPKFWTVLLAMLKAIPDKPIGLLSNHPRAIELAGHGFHAYRTNSWLVGPAYVMPRSLLEKFVAWFESLPDGNAPGSKGYANDDSSLNEWITHHGPGETWHPLPTIIEHRADLESTVGHGDRFSRERVSWRETRTVVDEGEGFKWNSWGCAFDIDELCDVNWWKTDAPMLAVGG